MQDNIAIRVKNLTKVYPLYDKPVDRLKEALNPFKKTYHHDFYAMNDVSFEIKKGETVEKIEFKVSTSSKINSIFKKSYIKSSIC